MSDSLQRQIIAELAVRAEIEPAAEIRRRLDFMKQYLLAAGPAKGFVLGISGGQDSTLAGRLAQLAVTELRAEGVAAEFIAVRLPYGKQFDEADAQKALDFINPDTTLVVNIKDSVDVLESAVNEAFAGRDSGNTDCANSERNAAAAGGTQAGSQKTVLPEKISDFNKGNVKARVRMTVQYAIAGDSGCLVLGTDHAAEAVTGFFTKHGDGAADLMPLAGLTKSQGAALLAELGAPAALWQKVPTADLLDAAPGQADESSLGITYTEIDAYLTGKPVSAQAAANLERRFLISRHKRQLPATVESKWWR